MDRPKGRLAPVLIVAGAFLCATLLAIYAAGYFVLGKRYDNSSSIAIGRHFSSEWQAWAYVPAAHIEARLKGATVLLCSIATDGANDFDVATWKIDP